MLASSAAVLATGIIGTALVFYGLTPLGLPAPPAHFWLWLVIASMLTLVSLGLRTLRWIFLLRRSETRIPIRDAYIGYLAGFALLLAPFLLGEMTIRAYVHRDRGNVPVAVSVVLNIWERFLDTIALAAIAATMTIVSGQITLLAVGVLVAIVTMSARPARRLSVRVVAACGVAFAKLIGHHERPEFRRLAGQRAWLAGLATSVVAWMLPGISFWGLGGIWRPAFTPVDAELAYASSTLVGALSMAPGGIVIAGRRMLGILGAAGLSSTDAALTVLGIRLVTAGLSTVLGGLFLLIHLRSRSTGRSHFDEVADAYDVQIPAARRHALLLRKTELMEEMINTFGVGRRGLDVGCGQGWYVRRMRGRGFDVTGVDSSPEQVQIAQRNVGSSGLVRLGSILQIPAADETYDFAYAINVLHHLTSIEEQRTAFTELIRVVRPGGLLFVHEINTQNVLFRFYMGYVFPSLNCIDEGVERWLLPNQLARYTHAPVVDVRYFTFLPEFAPATLVTLLAPFERRLEKSRLGLYSAHYMAAVRKPA
ncbi:MAG: hypothetical protein C5B57_12995 [Blastocatellia bacterium]|nr:MAG: hypothetical protein C5B57_12995 [Blastocatellia bacterium]